MAHLPVNHQLRPFYRFLAGASGVYLTAFGVVGAIRTWGDPFFDRGTTEALGLRTNLAFSLLSILVGVIVLAGAFIGRNIDHFINLAGGAVFMGAGVLMLLLLQTDANLLNFQVSTCIVSYIIGTILFLAGLYGKVGSQAEAEAEDAFRHSARGAVSSATKHRPRATAR